MTLRDYLKKPFWGPTDLACVTGISVSQARIKLNIVRDELQGMGYLNISRSRVPAKELIQRLNIDVDWLEKNGSLDAEVNYGS